MTKKERLKLRAAMSGIIAEHVLTGERLTTGQVFEMTVVRFPDLIDEAKERLLRKSLVDMARSLLKEAGKQDQEEMQVNLFGNSLPELKIPKCIALPPEPGSREMIWTSIMKATLAEIEQYTKFLSDGAHADLAKARKLEAFHTYVMSVSPSDDVDTPIEELLQGLKGREAI